MSLAVTILVFRLAMRSAPTSISWPVADMWSLIRCVRESLRIPLTSYGVKIGNRKEELLDYDPCYLGLADSEKKRAESYAAWVKETIAAEEWELIRKSLQRGQLTGSPRFVDEIEKKIERRVEFRGPGRPRKVEK
jgi:putative transposase